LSLDIGQTNVATSGTRVQLSSDGGLHGNERIVWAQFKGKPGNTGIVYVGVADVTTSHGWSLSNDDDIGIMLTPGLYGGSILASDIWFDAATNNDDVEWAIIWGLGV